MTIRIPGELERWREALHAVDRAPGREWRGKIVHHGSRALLVAALAAAVPFLFTPHSLPEFEELREGDRVTRDVVAEVPFTVYKSESQLEAERREAELSVPPVFGFEPAVADSAVGRVRSLFAQIDSLLDARDTSEAADTTAVREILQRFGLPYSDEQVVFLLDSRSRDRLRMALEAALARGLSGGVVSAADLDGVESPVIRVRDPDGERLLSKDSVTTVRDFLSAAAARAPRNLSAPGRDLFQTMLVRFVQPSLVLDREATRQAREWARSAVESAAGYVLEGATIVVAGERLDRQDLEKLRAYRAKLQEEGIIGGMTSFWRSLGAALLALALLGTLGVVLFFFRPEVYRDGRAFVLVYLLVALVLGLSSLVGSSGSSPALIPVAFAALLIAALFDGLLAIVVVMLVALLLSAQPPFEALPLALGVTMAGAAAALGVREVRHRSQSWILIALITGGYLLAGLALLLLGLHSIRDVLSSLLWGGLNATASTAVAMGAALPALEKITGRTTAQTLLEYADLNQPLLRRLSREAPGTYAHSVSLANLAEAACQAVGANALLARVGVYYHDIGKLIGPQYFVENQPKGLNPHDRLPPERSAEIIREHVREGLRLADEAGLPSVIRDFIREHHGTQQISYFLAKAREQDPDAAIDPGDFCYPGPKPQSKETAIVMLADAVESAARTLSDPTPERIRQLIDRLVDARVEDGQLDESPLTLRDLDIIRSEFARVLTGLYHHRIDYPVGGALGAPKRGEPRKGNEARPKRDSGKRRGKSGPGTVRRESGAGPGTGGGAEASEGRGRAASRSTSPEDPPG